MWVTIILNHLKKQLYKNGVPYPIQEASNQFTKYY